MITYAKDKNEIVVENKSLVALYILVPILLFLPIMGLKILFPTLRRASGSGQNELIIYSAIILCVWFAAVLLIAFFAICKEQHIVICDEGIKYSTVLFKGLIKWSEIESYGMAYFRTERHNRRVYCLYFAKDQKFLKGSTRRILKGMLTMSIITPDDFPTVTATIFTFCKERTDVKPFIGGETFAKRLPKN